MDEKIKKVGPHKHSLVNSLQELALVFADLGVVDLPHQLGVFVDEPCFPEYIGSCVLNLEEEVEHDSHVPRIWKYTEKITQTK